MHLTEDVKKKWEAVLDHDDLPEISDPYRRNVTTQLLENQEENMIEEGLITETAANYSGDLGSGTNIDSFDPVLISLVRRAMPNLIAYDIASVQPMTGPTGLIFAMRARYQTGANNDLTDDPEALYNEALTAFSGAASDGDVGDITGPASDVATDPSLEIDAAGSYTTGTGMTTAQAEALGNTGDPFAEMGFTIEKVTVTAKSRALKAEYTLELAQDLKKIHGLDAETELSNILTTEIMTEINREVVRTIFNNAKIGATEPGVTTTAGEFDLDKDSNGRWTVERFKGLLYHIEREANAIARDTRRGKGNMIICSSDVAAALAMAGVLDYTPALSTNLEVDDAGNTFAGVLNGRYRVYIDPYFASASGNHFMVVGYKGSSPYDAGLFYCPYVPLQMVRAVGENDFQPRIGFKTRYGLVNNPFAGGDDATAPALGALTPNANVYYRKLKIVNLM